MSADRIDQLVSHYMTSFRSNRESDAVVLGVLPPEDVAARRHWVAEELKAAEGDHLANNLEATESLAAAVLEEVGLPPSELGEEGLRRLCFRLLTARLEIMREEAERLPRGEPHGALHGTVAASPPPPENPRLSELFADYLAHRDASDPLAPNSRLEMIAASKVLLDLLGDPRIADVRNRDAQDFARRCALLPQRWRSKYKGKTASEVLADTEGQDIQRVDPATVKKELALLKAFWKWAATREELSRNVMDAVTPPDTGKAKDKRRPFTDADIAALRPAIEAQRVRRPERYWVTLLIAYSGARLEEVAQLRKEDIYEQGGIWCMRIRGDAGSVKNEASERDLPIHSRILELGFLEYVKATESARLFGDDGRTLRIGSPISKWFGWELNKLSLAERNKKGLHSFRHTMRDKLRLAGADPVIRREILGHAHGDIEDQVYGDPTSIKERKDAIELVALPL